MQDDEIFRLVFAAGLIAVLPVGFYHRVRSQATREPLDRRQEGLFILLTLRPIGMAGMLGLLAFVVNPRWMAWSSMPLPAAVRWCGVGIGIIGAALLVWTFRSLGNNITDTVVTRRHHTLVTTGPYRFIRHPFYVGGALAILANSLTAANWFIALAGGLGTALLVIRTTREEDYLARRFGHAYQEYVERTGRFVPKIPIS